MAGWNSRRAASVAVDRNWGAGVKRIRVDLQDQEGRPALIPPDVTDHSLTEVYNQCATMERLLDALAWAQTEASGLAGYQVERCHPTTSSITSDPHDNDLVLAGSHGALAKFEVSDVASSKDGNRKEERDLIRLGVLRKATGEEKMNVEWPEGRLFLAVSGEFAQRLRRPTRMWLKGPAPHCRYIEVKNDGRTRIFEILPGATSP